MKKCILIIIAVLVVMGQALIPAEAKPKKNQKPKQTYASPKPAGLKDIEIKLGLNLAYDWWQPAFIKLQSGMTGNVTAKDLGTTYSGSFMLGPVLWIKVGSAWNIGISALFGCSEDIIKYSTQAVDNNLLYLTIPQSPYSVYIENGTLKSRRYETGISVEHPIHKYFNLLFGSRFKYIDGEGSADRSSTLFYPFSQTKQEYYAWYVGPSVGVGFYYEVKGFSIKMDISALIQGGIYYCQNSFISPLYGINFFAYIPDEFAVAYLAMGGEANLRFAYYVEKIRTEFWIGGRYAILPHISLYDAGSAYNGSYKKGWITGEIEQYGGINFGAAYKF